MVVYLKIILMYFIYVGKVLNIIKMYLRYITIS